MRSPKLRLLRCEQSESGRLGVDGRLPVAVHVAGAEGETVVHQGGVDHETLLGAVQQVAQVAQVSEAAPHAVSRAVLVQAKYLARAEPTLRSKFGLQNGQNATLSKNPQSHNSILI